MERIEPIRLNGKVTEVIGLVITSEGPGVRLGELCLIETQAGDFVRAEVVGFRESKVLLMPLGEMNGIAPGAEVIATGHTLEVEVERSFGPCFRRPRPAIDGRGDLGTGIFAPPTTHLRIPCAEGGLIRFAHRCQSHRWPPHLWQGPAGRYFLRQWRGQKHSFGNDRSLC